MGRFLPYLAMAARDARRSAGATTTAVSVAANMDVSTIRRFERAASWPRDPDALIAVYATIAGRSPRDIWAAALQLWPGP